MVADTNPPMAGNPVDDQRYTTSTHPYAHSRPLGDSSVVREMRSPIGDTEGAVHGCPCRATGVKRLRHGKKQKGSRRVLPVEIHKRRQRPTFPLSSIIGGRSLTTVFGMGTGVASHLWSPTNPAAGLHRRPVVFVVSQTSRTERINALGDKGRQPDLVLNAAS